MVINVIPVFSLSLSPSGPEEWACARVCVGREQREADSDERAGKLSSLCWKVLHDFFDYRATDMRVNGKLTRDCTLGLLCIWEAFSRLRYTLQTSTVWRLCLPRHAHVTQLMMRSSHVRKIVFTSWTHVKTNKVVITSGEAQDFLWVRVPELGACQ